MWYLAAHRHQNILQEDARWTEREKYNLKLARTYDNVGCSRYLRSLLTKLVTRLDTPSLSSQSDTNSLTGVLCIDSHNSAAPSLDP